MGLGRAGRLFVERYGHPLLPSAASAWPLLDRLIEEGRLPSLSRTLVSRLLGHVADEREALFLAYLFQSAQEGHLCVEVGRALSPDPCETWLEGHELADEIVRKIMDGPVVCEGVCTDGKRYYLQRLWLAEEGVKEGIAALCGGCPTIEFGVVNLPEALLPEQREAVVRASRNRFSLIVGGPGTGKTYTAAQLVDAFRGSGGRVGVAAPTGKAAGNLQRALGESVRVQTLHAMLGYPRRKGRLLGEDLIVVDEAAMVDVHLMRRLVCSIKPGARLVLMGDSAQLPPVETGGLFGQLVEHRSLSDQVTCLGRCVRTDEAELLDLAECVKEGDVAGVRRLVSWGPSEGEVVDWIVRRLPEVNSVEEAHLFDSFRVLTALRKGPYGSLALNEAVLSRLKGRGKMFIPIIIVRNDYRLGLYNGDMGVLVSHRAGERHVDDYVRFPDGRQLSVFGLPPHEVAYCLSVHKSQGSEFASVALVAPPGAEIFGRELLYTALTRAKREFVLCGSEEVVEGMVRRHARCVSGVYKFDFKSSSKAS